MTATLLVTGVVAALFGLGAWLSRRRLLREVSRWQEREEP